MNFKNFFIERVIKETLLTTVGVYPGAFKPPHRGHYEAIKKASAECDQVHVFISSQPRDMITSQMSKKVWDVFARNFPNVITSISAITPVKDAYELVGAFNNKENASSYNINLYASPDDMKRFDRIPKFSDKLNVVNKVETTNQSNDIKVSAKNIREAIKNNDWLYVKNMMPDEVDKDEILIILKNNEEQ